MSKIALCRHCGKSFEYHHACDWTQPPPRCADCRRAHLRAYYAAWQAKQIPKRDQLLACVDCGTSFPSPKAGRCPTRCKPCRSRHALASRKQGKCESCGKPCGGRRCRGCYVSAGRKQIKGKCESCEKPCEGRRCRGCYQPANKGTINHAPLTCSWCSQPFAFSVNKRTRKPREYCSPACWQRTQAARARKICETCGAAFRKSGGRTLGKYCSVKCYGLAKRGPHKLARELSDWFEAWDLPQLLLRGVARMQARTQERLDARSKLVPFTCVDCGADGVTPQAGSKRRLRCDKCRKRKERLPHCHRKHFRGRCRRYCVPYDPQVKSAAVFERDGYVCQMCGCATLRRYTRDLFGHVDRKSPTVDHIEPLHWRGKGHTWDNVRLLCVHCNCVERNRKGHAKTVKSRKARRTPAR